MADRVDQGQGKRRSFSRGRQGWLGWTGMASNFRWENRWSHGGARPVGRPAPQELIYPFGDALHRAADTRRGAEVFRDADGRLWVEVPRVSTDSHPRDSHPPPLHGLGGLLPSRLEDFYLLRLWSAASPPDTRAGALSLVRPQELRVCFHQASTDMSVPQEQGAKRVRTDVLADVRKRVLMFLFCPVHPRISCMSRFSLCVPKFCVACYVDHGPPSRRCGWLRTESGPGPFPVGEAILRCCLGFTSGTGYEIAIAEDCRLAGLTVVLHRGSRDFHGGLGIASPKNEHRQEALATGVSLGFSCVWNRLLRALGNETSTCL